MRSSTMRVRIDSLSSLRKLTLVLLSKRQWVTISQETSPSRNWLWLTRISLELHRPNTKMIQSSPNKPHGGKTFRATQLWNSSQPSATWHQWTKIINWSAWTLTRLQNMEEGSLALISACLKLGSLSCRLSVRLWRDSCLQWRRATSKRNCPSWTNYLRSSRTTRSMLSSTPSTWRNVSYMRKPCNRAPKKMSCCKISSRPCSLWSQTLATRSSRPHTQYSANCRPPSSVIIAMNAMSSLPC